MAAVVVPISGEILPPTNFVLETHVTPRPELKVDAKPLLVEDGLTVEDCCRMFEEAEEASMSARELSERDRDYYDGKQLSPEETADLRRRGQPEVVLNMIRQKINYLIGLEKTQRTKPKSLPRTPMHENDAHACTDALRYVVETQKYHNIRSEVWKHLLIEGAAACCVSVEPKAAMPGPMGMPTGPSFDVKLRLYSWDRFFADPHSVRTDYSDATYLGTVLWMDRADAVAMYGDDIEDVIDATLSTAANSETYDDKPSWMVWADRKRKRIRIVQMWIKRAGEWYFAEFTKGGFLKTGPSPYVDGDGRTDCEIVAQSAYVDRDNNRYGEVRELVSPQDEINKRRSKSLHILNTNQVVAEEGAVADEEKARREAVKPDGWVTLNPGMMDKFRFEQRGEMANGQFKLLEHTMNVFALMGPNASMQGNAGEEASGRAILASQQGGMIQTGSLMDQLRDFDQRVFEKIWNRIRQHWDGPMWVRVTDDERNIRFVGLNGAVDPQTGQPGVPVAQADIDIIIDDAPDGVAPAIEQFQSLVELKKFDVNNELSFRVLVEAMPNLKNKDKLLDMMDQQQAAAQQAAQQQGPPPEIAVKMAELELKKQEAAQSLELEQAKAAVQAEQASQKLEFDRRAAAAKIEIENESAEAKARREWAATIAKIELNREVAAAKVQQEGQAQEAMAESEPDETAAGASQDDTNRALAAALEHIAQAMMAPKKIIRDSEGRPTGVAPVGMDVDRSDL